MTHGDGNHTQNQVKILEEDAPDPDQVDEPPGCDCAVNKGATPTVQADPELSTDGVHPEFSNDGVDLELSTGAVDPCLLYTSPSPRDA